MSSQTAICRYFSFPFQLNDKICEVHTNVNVNILRKLAFVIIKLFYTLRFSKEEIFSLKNDIPIGINRLSAKDNETINDMIYSHTSS